MVPDGEWGWIDRKRSNGLLKAEFGVKEEMLERLASA